jgi:hypothetical protein
MADNKGGASVTTPSAGFLAGGNDPAAKARGIYSDLMVALAGAATQQLAGCVDNSGDEDDSVYVGSCAGMLARLEAGLLAVPGPDESCDLNPGDPLHAAALRIVRRALAETETLVRDNWLAVVRVAGVLAKRDRLTQAELDHVIANGQRE